MKIATWNVNSVKARRERLLAFLERESPDVLCLQELKAVEAQFPHDDIRNAGYQAAVLGEKTYNGVAILSKLPLENVRTGLGDNVSDPQSRLISASIAGTRILSVYVPNGGEPGSEKYNYKMQWLARLQAHLQRLLEREPDLVLCGDLNIAPDDRDVANPEQWNQSVLCLPEVRAEFHKLLALGLEDVFRKHHESAGLYSWWDYRMLGFAKNNGLRIDHILATPRIAALSSDARVDRDERKGKRPSDHAPVLASFNLN